MAEKIIDLANENNVNVFGSLFSQGHYILQVKLVMKFQTIFSCCCNFSYVFKINQGEEITALNKFPKELPDEYETN